MVLLRELELVFGHTDAQTDGRMEEGQIDVKSEIVTKMYNKSVEWIFWREM